MRGQVIQVPVREAPGNNRVGRFGWKSQHVSLLSFSSDAYLNEMGITNRLAPNNDEIAHTCDDVPDVEDTANDIDRFAAFMRSTKAPPRDAAVAGSPDSIAGEALFNQIGCATCHVGSIVTAPVGALVAGGTFHVPSALGNKVIHPFSDFLLHDIGTGDGIAQTRLPNGLLDQSTKF